MRLGAGPGARPDRPGPLISGYLGDGEFDSAIADFALAYADQNEKDYQHLVDAIERRQLTAIEGI